MSIEYREVTTHDIPQLAKILMAEWESELYWMRRISGYVNRELHPQTEALCEMARDKPDDNIVINCDVEHPGHQSEFVMANWNGSM